VPKTEDPRDKHGDDVASIKTGNALAAQMMQAPAGRAQDRETATQPLSTQVGHQLQLRMSLAADIDRGAAPADQRLKSVIGCLRDRAHQPTFNVAMLGHYVIVLDKNTVKIVYFYHFSILVLTDLGSAITLNV
jgi:hypothetical protein